MHESFMLAALEQAQQGQGICAPNPCVGAVVVQNGIIIAQAWHKGAGTRHAESLVLEKLPPKLKGLSLYVTLEPCNHWGRTPPCVDSLIEYGIEAVYFGYKDPNPLVAKNNGIARLQAHQITVQQITLPAVEAFYRSYHYWTRTQKPWVTVKMAQTLDGKIAAAGGKPLALSNKLCSEFTHTKRRAADILLTTAKTILQDDPQMNVRLNGEEEAKEVAILDSQLCLKKDRKIFSKAKHCHVFHDAKLVALDYPNSTFYPIPLKDGTMDLAQVIVQLGSMGYHDVFVEVGATVFAALHLQGLVQTTYLYIVPTNLGPEAFSAYPQTGIFARKHQVSWQAMGDNMIACLQWGEPLCLLD